MGNLKSIFFLIGVAFLVITGVMLSLLLKGGALKPAGVIKPAPVGENLTKIGKQIAVRLFPDFQEAKHVIWYLEEGAEALAGIPITALAEYESPTKPEFHDLRMETQENCAEHCWYVLTLGSTAPASLEQKRKIMPTMEIFIQYFERDEKVPGACETEKILSVECMRPVSVREVRRKLKSAEPYYFMQRYQKAQFYLFVERPK